MIEYFAGTTIGVATVYLLFWLVRSEREIAGGVAIAIVASTIVASVVAVALVTLLVADPVVDVLNGLITGICIGIISRVAGSFAKR
ncbi:hypothetical protein [Gordonia sp. NPDC127522]|uniref:hypothetical protein n=1 Tax=Gordonia sp. NPDC127522 TaxID=3345390 RepID=UPI00363D55F3